MHVRIVRAMPAVRARNCSTVDVAVAMAQKKSTEKAISTQHNET